MAALNIFLNASAQSQLTQLKKINEIPLTRIDGQKDTVNKQKTAVNNVKSEIDQLQGAIQKLKTAKPEEQADAIKAFVKEYNDLQNLLRTQTDKGATLASLSEARMGRSELRSAFQDYDVLKALKDAGIETTRDGLAVGNIPEEVALDASSLEALERALSKLETRMDSVTERFDRRIKSLEEQRERVAAQVERNNKRTEQNFLKMYQLMQAMAQEGLSSMFGMVQQA